MHMDALAMHRLAKRLHHLGVPLLPSALRKLTLLLYTSYLPCSAEIGEGTLLGYGGIGIFVHPGAKVGRGCLISQFVGIGGRSGAEGTAEIGDYVRIGTGARILGRVHIGDFAVIGANSVVVKDVPAGAVVFGVPARVVRYMEDPVAEYERETGRPVAPADRERAPRSGVPVPATATLGPGPGPGNVVAEPGTPLFDPEAGSATAPAQVPAPLTAHPEVPPWGDLAH